MDGSRREFRGKNWVFIFACGFIFSFAYCGWSLYNRPLNQEAATALKIGIIQGNIPNEIKFDSGGWGRALEGYTMDTNS